jgi:ABC-type dipeptide/oligopeptide/nickel transport system permease subunit
VTAQALTSRAGELPAGRGVVGDAVSNLLRNRSARVGLTILGALALMAILAPVIAPYDPVRSLIGVGEHIYTPPCIHLLGCPASHVQHFAGLDQNGRDELSRVIFGARISLFIGFTTVGFAIVLGVIAGAVSGYAGGWIDNGIMRVMDVLLAFPSLLLAIAIVTLLGVGITNSLIAIGITQIPIYARVVRASVLTVKELDFVTAERALGASPFRILLRRVLPNSLTPLIVYGTLGIASAVLDAAALSFIGLGAQPPQAEWGRMIGDAKDQIFSAPYLIFAPGVALSLTVLGFNVLGDGLRDALDPRINR